MSSITFGSILFFIAIITWIVFLLSQIRLRLLLKRLEKTDKELQQLCEDTLAEFESWEPKQESG